MAGIYIFWFNDDVTICVNIFQATTVSNYLRYEAEPWINQARFFNPFLAVEEEEEFLGQRISKL